jgi:predicted  nucleic acid-binding Zn-ribbon protein
MIQPTQRKIAAAIRGLGSLRESIDALDTEEARRRALESSQERHLRSTKSRIVERLARIENSVAKLRRWARDLCQTQTQIRYHGNSV